MSGMDAAAGGVLSARSISSTKNATNIFIPKINQTTTPRLSVCINTGLHRSREIGQWVDIGATTAEKLEGTIIKWGGYRSPIFSSFIPSSSTLIAPPLQLQPFPFLLLLSSPSRLIPATRFGGSALSSPYSPAKMTDSCKRWRGPNTLGPHDLQSWRGRVPRVPYGGCQ